MFESICEGTYTKHGPGSMDGHPMDHPMDLVHGPGPWTTPNFQEQIAPVKMKIYHDYKFVLLG